MAVKMRVSGETISSNQIYSGSKVIKLLEVAFNNGKAAGRLEASTEHEARLQKKYEEAFEDGKIAAEQEYHDILVALDTIRDYFQREDE